MSFCGLGEASDSVAKTDNNKIILTNILTFCVMMCFIKWSSELKCDANSLDSQDKLTKNNNMSNMLIVKLAEGRDKPVWPRDHVPTDASGDSGAHCAWSWMPKQHRSI